MRHQFGCRAFGLGSRFVSGRRCTSHKAFDTYCQESVRSGDRASFLMGLLLPKEIRGCYFAIHAFNVEIATIRDQIPRNSVQAGRIRFQFWKDVVQQIYTDGTLPPANNQPVAQALCHYVTKHNLTSRWLERCLESRFDDMMGAKVMNTMDDLETYGEYSQSSLIYLMLETIGIKHEDTEFAASHLGVCKGIVTLLRGHEAHRAQGMCYFPREVMQKHGLTLPVAMKGPSTPSELCALQDTINDIASQAHAHLSKARELCAGSKDMPAKAHLALVSGVDCGLFLDELQKRDFLIEPGNENLQMVVLQMHLLRYMWTKRF